MPLSLNSCLKFILEILRSSTSSFKTLGCWESKILSFSHFNGYFNKVFVQCVPDFPGNTVRLSKKTISDDSMFQARVLKISLSCHLPLEAVVSQLHLYFCLWNESLLNIQTGAFAFVSYLQKQLSLVSSWQTPQASPRSPLSLLLAPSSVGTLSPHCPFQEVTCRVKGRGTCSWGLFSLIWGDGSWLLPLSSEDIPTWHVPGGLLPAWI